MLNQALAAAPREEEADASGSDGGAGEHASNHGAEGSGAAEARAKRAAARPPGAFGAMNANATADQALLLQFIKEKVGTMGRGAEGKLKLKQCMFYKAVVCMCYLLEACVLYTRCHVGHRYVGHPISTWETSHLTL